MDFPVRSKVIVTFDKIKHRLDCRCRLTLFFIRTSKFKFRLTVLNFFENLRLDCS